MPDSATSHLLPVFARVDLAFERGEGAWLIGDRRRALSRFHQRRRGQCARPLPPASGRGAAGAGHQSSGTCRTCSRARTATGSPRGCASRALPISCSSAIPAPRRWNARIKIARHYHAAKGKPERYRIITFEGAFHGRTLGDAGRDRLGQISRRLRPAAGRLRPGAAGDLEAVKKAIGPQHRRHPDRAGAGRGRRARRRRMRSSGRCANSATTAACC